MKHLAGQMVRHLIKRMSEFQERYELAFQESLMYHSVKQQKSKERSLKNRKLSNFVCHPRREKYHTCVSCATNLCTVQEENVQGMCQG
jgi:hypothetical protein